MRVVVGMDIGCWGFSLLLFLFCSLIEVLFGALPLWVFLCDGASLVVLLLVGGFSLFSFVLRESCACSSRVMGRGGR